MHYFLRVLGKLMVHGAAQAREPQILTLLSLQLLQAGLRLVPIPAAAEYIIRGKLEIGMQLQPGLQLRIVTQLTQGLFQLPVI